MQLNLKKLFDSEDQVMPFEQVLDLKELELWGEKPFKAPIAISGKAESRAGILTIRYCAEYTLTAACARCLTTVDQKHRREFTHTIVRELNQQNDDDYIIVTDGLLELDTVALDDILLELPIRMLCAPSCKGLCPRCGCDLNQSQCECVPEKWDGGRVKAFDNL